MISSNIQMHQDLCLVNLTKERHHMQKGLTLRQIKLLHGVNMVEASLFTEGCHFRQVLLSYLNVLLKTKMIY